MYRSRLDWKNEKANIPNIAEQYIGLALCNEHLTLCFMENYKSEYRMKEMLHEQIDETEGLGCGGRFSRFRFVGKVRQYPIA